ncbi:RdgB/HAM1 family non-canonical purine NTP pyrophosphatase [bacterium]|nr:RdgB/HAM1 family non-canonical purine NTP pyrophosphatase [bacterium]
MKLLLATHNKHKAEEIRKIWQTLKIELITLTDVGILEEIVEDGETLEENALIKARYAFAKTGLSSVADDTGLEVEALDGDPGVYSARYAGENVSYKDNNLKLLSELGNVPQLQRNAVFKTVVALVDEKGEIVVEGQCHGQILSELSGTGGFGYDPLFFVPELGMSFAEMNADQKNRISHRGNAFRKMELKINARYF